MSDAPGMLYCWDGHTMVPLNRFARLAESSFKPGRCYRLAVDEERSSQSHRQYFAAVRDAFMNLPEHLADRFADEHHLRKWCLIKAGFRNERHTYFTSAADAMIAENFIHQLDDYALVVRDGPVLTVYTAKSQSYRAMSKREFQRSKTAVFDELARMLDVTPQEFTLAAGRAA